MVLQLKKNKTYLKIFLSIIAMVAFETIMYKLGGLFSSTQYTLSSSLDNNIPFIPEFIYPYIFWYIMIVTVPFLIFIKNPTNFYKYMTSLFITIIISTIIFILFPTTVNRPDIEVENISLWLVNLIYLLDTPSLCCLPSMHCMICFLMIIYSLFTKEFNIYKKGIITILSLLVVASTLFIKQHVIIDALLALIITIITIFFVNKFNLHKYFEKILKKSKCI